MLQPTTRYALAGDVHIAYQVVGDGPVDLVWAWGLASNIEVVWEEPAYAAFLRRLAEFSRLILYDRRGCGVSDREGTTVTPTLEERMEDVIAVLDAVGAGQASIFGVSDGGNLAAALAATYPQRVSSIILWATVARFDQDAEHPFRFAGQDSFADVVEWMRRGWGTVPGAENALHLWAPSMVGDERFAAWLAKHCRQAVSRGGIVPLLWSSTYVYVAEVFPTVHVPALVLHRTDDRLVPIGQSRSVADLIPDAEFVELPGADHYPFVGDTDAVLAEIEGFLLGSRSSSYRQRKLLTVLSLRITDAADSLNLTQGAWSALLAAHDEMTRAHLTRFTGREVRRAGHDLLAVFDGPGRAIRCALGIVDAAARSGLRVGAGLHAGECDVVDEDVSGITVSVAVSVAEAAGPGNVLASGTVRDLVPGSGIRFGRRRVVELSPLPDPQAVFPVLAQGVAPDTVRRLAIDQDNLLRRDGEYWTVAYGGLVVTLRDRKGLGDLARLLAAPQREHHVLDLAAPARGSPIGLAGPEMLQNGLRVDHGLDEPILDDTAIASYKRRIAELEQDIDEADAVHDSEVSAKSRQELDAIVTELATAYGLAGRPRRIPDHVERARKTVGRRIRTAIDSIEQTHPTLGRHLRASVRTGVFCSYSPERDVAWTVVTGQ
jgi:pimeloyl-ACP methyl ester carboxylesterase